jgi:transcriptional regulator with XRE-family HTH domain
MTRTPAVTPEQFATFGELLRYLRRRAGLTQRELSIAVGYSDAHLSRLEKGERVPDRDTFGARLTEALEASAEWMKQQLADA